MRSPHADSAGPGPRRLCVLLAEDCEPLRLLAGRLIGLLGHDVVAVGDGEQAVRAASDRHFDVALLDVQMPRMGGVEAARELRAAHGGECPRIVGLSADADAEERFAELGMDDFVAKPARPADLARVLGGSPWRCGS